MASSVEFLELLREIREGNERIYRAVTDDAEKLRVYDEALSRVHALLKSN